MPLNKCGSVSARFSVWFSRVNACAELLDGRREDFEAAGIVRRELGFAANQVQRRATLRPRFGQDQRSRVEVESSQTDFARNLRAGAQGI